MTGIRHLLRIVRLALALGLTLLVAPLLGGGLAPLTHDFFVDVALWFALLTSIGAAYSVLGWRAHRLAGPVGLSEVRTIAGEVVALVGGGFFGCFFAALAVHEAGATASSGRALGIGALSLVGLAACGWAVARAVGYGRGLMGASGRASTPGSGPLAPSTRPQPKPQRPTGPDSPLAKPTIVDKNWRGGR